MPIPYAVALHEAAHAVVSVYLGLRIEKVTLIPDGNVFAGVHGEIYHPPAVPLQPTAAELDKITRFAQQAYAGLLAERKKFGAGHDHGGANDIADVETFAQHLFATSDEWVPWRGKTYSASKKCVDHLWPAILDVAAALLDSGDQSHDDVRAALTKHHL
jgi:hypothetical protein